MENKKFLKIIISLIAIVLIMGGLFVFYVLKYGYWMGSIEEISYPSNMTSEVENAIDEKIVNKIL